MFSERSDSRPDESRTVAVTSIRSSACSISSPILFEGCEAETTTSGFFQDFTSMRPLAMFWIMTTGRPLTRKCLSTFWPAATEASGIRNNPAPSTGASVKVRFLRTARLRVILVYAPASFHHGGQNLCLLLISCGKIVTRDLIVRIFLQALAAFLDEGV